MWLSKYKSHATISTNKRRNRVVLYPYCIHMRIITSVSYPLCNKRKQATALLPTLSEKHRATHVFSLKHGSDGYNYNIIYMK